MNFGKIYDFFYEKRKALALILLAAIVIFAFWLRYRLLGVKDFWIDEYFTEDGAFYTLKGLWLKGHTRTTLFFSFIMKCYASTISFFTHKNYLTPFELRLPNVVFGTLLVALVYFAVRKISDIFTALFTSLVCAVFPYLVYYSRDGRYYPLFLVCVAICFWAAFSILSTPFDDKKQIKYHLAYMLGGFCGMFTHYGFWIYFAISNIALCLILCYRFFLESSNDSFIKKAGKSALQVLAMAIPALMVPIIVYNKGKTSIDGSGVSLVFSEKLYDKTHLIDKLSYDFLSNFCQEFYSDFKFLVAYGLIIIAIISVLLLILHNQRKSILYLAMIRFGTFAILRFVPRNVVHEALRPRYIIFILLIDLVLFCLFSCELIKYIGKALSYLNKKLSIAIYLLLALALTFTVSYYSSKKVFDSKLKIYKPFTMPSKTVEKMKEFYSDGDVILTDVMDAYYALPYYKKTDKELENIKCFFIGWIDHPSIKNARVLLLTQRQGNFLPNVHFLGNFYGLYYNRYIIPDDICDKDLALIVSKIVNSTVRQAKPTLDSWAKIKSNVIQYISTPHEEKNLILNPDFSNGFDNWRVSKNGYADISLVSTNGRNIVKFTGKGDWSTLAQSIDVKAGITNKFIIDLKCDDWSEGLDVVLSYTDPDNKINYISFPKIQATNSWTKTIKLLPFEKSGSVPVRIQYRNKTDEGTVYVSQIKVVELRDTNAPVVPSEQAQEIDPNQVLKNSDFQSYYAHWTGQTENFIIKESDGEKIITFTPLSVKRTWFKLKQFFTANKGDVYELSYDEKCLYESSPQSKAFLVFSYVDEKGVDAGEKYFQLDSNGKTPDWQHKTHKINITDTQKSCFRLQFTGHPYCEVKNIKLIKVYK